VTAPSVGVADVTSVWLVPGSLTTLYCWKTLAFISDPAFNRDPAFIRTQA